MKWKQQLNRVFSDVSDVTHNIYHSQYVLTSHIYVKWVAMKIQNVALI